MMRRSKPKMCQDYLLAAPIWKTELQTARTRKALLVDQSDQLTKYGQTLSDLIADVSCESLTKFVASSTMATIEQIKTDLKSLGEHKPAQRGDVSQIINSIESRLTDAHKSIADARNQKEATAQLKLSLTNDITFAQQTLDFASKPELKGEFDDLFVKTIKSLLRRITDVASLDLWELKDKQRDGPNSEVATTRLLSSNWSSGRSYLCDGDAGDREQPTNNQL